MKKKSILNRRQFINLGSKIVLTLPLVSTIGCGLGKSYSLNPKDSLKKLILLLGPWSTAEKLKADDFVKRFFKVKHNVEPYIPAASKIIKSLAGRFSSETKAIDKINLKSLPHEEQELLMTLTKQLYSFTEVRFQAANTPPWGHCQGDPMWHTRAPLHNKV